MVDEISGVKTAGLEDILHNNIKDASGEKALSGVCIAMGHSNSIRH